MDEIQEPVRERAEFANGADAATDVAVALLIAAQPKDTREAIQIMLANFPTDKLTKAQSVDGFEQKRKILLEIVESLTKAKN